MLKSTKKLTETIEKAKKFGVEQMFANGIETMNEQDFKALKLIIELIDDTVNVMKEYDETLENMNKNIELLLKKEES